MPHSRDILLIFLVLHSLSGYAQDPDSLQVQNQDQAVDTVQSIDPADPTQLIIAYEEASQSLREMGNELQIGFDISSIDNQYQQAKPRLDNYRRIGEVNLQEVSLSRINDIITIFEGQLQTLENWQTSLMSIIHQLSDYRIELVRHKKRLSLDRQDLTDDQNRYYEDRHLPLLNEIDSISLLVDEQLHDVLDLEYQISEQYVSLRSRIQDLKSFLVTYWDDLLLKDTISWKVHLSEVGFLKGFKHRSSDTAWRIIDFYRVNKAATIQLIMLFFLLVVILNRIKKEAQKLTGDGSEYAALYKNPIALSLLLSGLLFPAIFPPTTSLMYDFALIVSYIPFLFILYSNLEMKFLRTYLIFIIALFLLKVHNAFFAAPALEAGLIIMCGLVFIYTVLPNTIRRFYEIRWKWIVAFNWILGFILIAGLVFILFKRVRLGTILITGTGDTIALALILIYLGNWSDLFIRFLKQRLGNLSSNKERLEEFWTKWSNRIYLALLILFLVAFLRNFSLFKPTRDAITEFLVSTRTVGDLSFSFGGIVLFFLVLYVSAGLSSAIQFFAEDKSYLKTQKKTANVAVILRFLLITVGFVLALLVSGIPIDRIAIILGALSVGIGFGLQNIVNNLISGIILVFERPIQTGDVVELQQYTGLVKDIGIRSSIIKTYDGAEVIVPNGNLISQEVINWTLSSRQRRVEVMAGVAYGSNAEQVIEILHGVMNAHTKVLKLPAPQVLFSSLGDSSLNFVLRFWTSDIDHWMQTQSEITSAVYKALNQADISIPFPQRDLHIKSWEAGAPGDLGKRASDNSSSSAKKSTGDAED